MSNIAKATKENISKYNLYKEDQEVLSVISNNKVSCRIAKTKDKIQLFINNEMDYIDLSWGNYQRNIILEKAYSGEIILSISIKEND